MQIVKHPAVELKLPQFNVDNKLHKKLDDIELLSLMNKHFCCAMIGRAGSGKTSLLTGLFATKAAFKKVFDKVFYFVPPNSLASVRKSIFKELPKEQIISELTPETLGPVFHIAEEMRRHEKNTCIIFDDLQQFYRGDCEPLLTHMVNNRRHNRLSLIFIAQSYKKMPRMIRQALSDVFLFKISKDDYLTVFKEIIDLNSKFWEQALRLHKTTIKSGDSHAFLYFNAPEQRCFLNWDELVELDDDVTDGLHTQLQTEKVRGGGNQPGVVNSRRNTPLRMGVSLNVGNKEKHARDNAANNLQGKPKRRKNSGAH